METLHNYINGALVESSTSRFPLFITPRVVRKLSKWHLAQ